MWKREMRPVTIRYRIWKITSSHYLTVWAQFSCNLDESKTDRKEILSFLRLCRSDYRFFLKLTCDRSFSAGTYFLKNHILDPGAQHIAPIKKCSKELRKPRKYAKWWRKRFSSKVIFIPGGPKNFFSKVPTGTQGHRVAQALRDTVFMLNDTRWCQAMHWYRQNWIYSFVTVHFNKY